MKKYRFMILASLLTTASMAYADSMVCKGVRGTANFSVVNNEVIGEVTINGVNFKGHNPKFSSVRQMVETEKVHVYNSSTEQYLEIDAEGSYVFGADAYYIDQGMFGCQYSAK